MFHAQQMQDYGTNVVAGMTPGKGGQRVLDGTRAGVRHRAQAVHETGANTVGDLRARPPARPTRSSRRSARASRPIFCITEHIPVLDMLKVVPRWSRPGARLIGPNCPGVTSVGKAKVGIIPGYIHREGHVGLVSRSGTLTYEVVQALTEAGIGQSTCVGIGGDPIAGSNFIDILRSSRTTLTPTAWC